MDDFRIQQQQTTQQQGTQQQTQQALQQDYALEEEIERAAFRAAAKQGEFQNVERGKFELEELMEGSLALKKSEAEGTEFTKSLEGYSKAKRLLYNSKDKKRGYFDRKRTKDKVKNLTKEVQKSQSFSEGKSAFKEMYEKTQPLLAAYNLSSRVVMQMIEHTLESQHMDCSAYLEAIANNKEMPFVKDLRDIKTSTAQYDQYVQISENDIVEYINKEIVLRDWAQICTELKTMPAADTMLDYKDSLVELKDKKDVEDCGIASQVQHFPKIVADAFVKKSGGFLTRTQNKKDKQYSLRPSVPAIAIPEYQIKDLRRSYNLFCKLFSTYALKQEGKPAGSTLYDKIRLVADASAATKAVFEKAVLQLFSDMQPSAKMAKISKEDIKEIKKLYLASCDQGVGFGIFRELATQITGNRSNHRNFEAFMEDYQKDPSIIAELKRHYDSYKDSSDVDADTAVKEILEGFQKQDESAILDLENVSKINADSEDVPLFGACSSSAGMIHLLHTLVNTTSENTLFDVTRLKPVHCSYMDPEGAFQQMGKTVVAKILKNFEGYKTELKLKDTNKQLFEEFIASKDNPESVSKDRRESVEREVRNILFPLCTFEYHKIAPVAESTTHVISVEAFAAETNQLTTAPFQRETSYVGVYQKSATDKAGEPATGNMRKYYGKDPAIDLGKKRLAKELKDFISTYIETRASEQTEK